MDEAAANDSALAAIVPPAAPEQLPGRRCRNCYWHVQQEKIHLCVAMPPDNDVLRIPVPKPAKLMKPGAQPDFELKTSVELKLRSVPPEFVCRLHAYEREMIARNWSFADEEAPTSKLPGAE